MSLRALEIECPKCHRPLVFGIEDTVSECDIFCGNCWQGMTYEETKPDDEMKE